ncbi:transcriptional regulator [Motiliproteus coralliicola]|uniref:Transcriptional regulator n=1 Tax=Motiliproteus coralliicola TaxID=2283196 RepID=A0A369WAV9_9GAMM|nr:helix-turn-helix domain-containing protein [Motiliproteus coralliicola]RDE18431.1 transcriptional regulator [Motiliproteus coralliicola]
MVYNQFCPISKAMEVLGEKWTLLIVRDALCGSTRFNEFQRGLSQISPTVLTKRLSQMVDEGLLFKKRIPGQRGYEYFPTQACKELYPVIEQMGIWGMHWARHQLTEEDYDLELLMLYLERSIQPQYLLGKETVIRFNFSDVKEYPSWWLVVSDDQVDVCVHDPGKEVDVYLNCCVRVMCQLWMGDISYRAAINQGELELVGPKQLTGTIQQWIKPSLWAGLQPASDIVA